MKKMLRVLQSENFIRYSTSRVQAKRYVEMYVWWKREPQDDPGELPF